MIQKYKADDFIPADLTKATGIFINRILIQTKNPDYKKTVPALGTVFSLITSILFNRKDQSFETFRLIHCHISKNFSV